MAGLQIPISGYALLDWDYAPALPRIQRLLEMTRRMQWDEANDIDWTSQDLIVGEASDFGRAAFEASTLARYGGEMWRRFRHEQQAWMVGQFLHGEQSALVVSSRLTEVLPEVAAKSYAANQAAEEARHVAVLARYTAERVATPYPVSPSFEQLLGQILRDWRWDFQVLGMHVMVESLALGAFRIAANTFEDSLIRRITELIARDEARHVSFGILLLEDFYAKLGFTELREREDFVLEAAELLSRRYLMSEVWTRLGIDLAEGSEFSRRSQMMRAYRCALFARVVHTLGQVGLLTSRVREGMEKLGLVGAIRSPAISDR